MQAVSNAPSILVAVDGSESSMSAVRMAARLAKSTGARLSIIHVISFPGEAYSSGYPRMISAEKKARKNAEDYLSSAKKAAEEYGVDPGLQIVEDLESPVRGITEFASENGVDLIVTGTRDVGSLKRSLTGSVSRGVVNSAPCSVLVARKVTGSLVGARESEKKGEAAGT